MRRREALTAISGRVVASLAGCTITSQNGTDNAAGTEATSEVEDGILSINGKAWYLCHSGLTEKLVVTVEVLADDVVQDTLMTTVEAPQCGVEYEYSFNYNLDNIDGDWSTISINVELVERQ